MDSRGQSWFSRLKERLGARRARRKARELEPFYRELEEITTTASEARRAAGRWPPGHFYSPIPSGAEIRWGVARARNNTEFGGIDMRDAAQRELLGKLALEYPRLRFEETPNPDTRFFFTNPSYGHYDAVLLACMILHFRPARIVEVGSGFTSMLMLDVNDRYFDGSIQLTFVEPNPRILNANMRPEDRDRARVIEQRVQDAPLSIFRELEANDILFIDSSHVAKTGSDVNHLFFEVLPVIRPGVLVHLHDITGNFEYPEEWLLEGRVWNEIYLLRAFLMHNRAFEVLLHSVRVRERNGAFMREAMPLCMQGGGGQFWIRRTGED